MFLCACGWERGPDLAVAVGICKFIEVFASLNLQKLARAQSNPNPKLQAQCTHAEQHHKKISVLKPIQTAHPCFEQHHKKISVQNNDKQGLEINNK